MNDPRLQAKRDWSRRHREALREMGLNAHGEPYAVPDTDTRRGGTGIRYVKVRVDDARRLLELAALTDDQSPGERAAVRRVASVMP